MKSGINAKPTSSVMEQQCYPHFSLGRVSRFIDQNIKFKHLSYEQFMAGELTTIINAPTMYEREGRTGLLQRVTLWKLRTNVSWPQVRGAYAHIMTMLENCEISWDADWDRYERHIYDRINSTVTLTTKNDRPRRTNNNTATEMVWFCKAYQKLDGCSKEAPHNGKVGNMYRQLHHICAVCWLKEKIKRYHPECANECPNKEI